MSTQQLNRTQERIAVAKQLNVKDRDIWEWIGICESMFYKCKAGSRILQSPEMARLNSLIAERAGIAQAQGILNFESVTPVETAPDSPFDLRVLKVTNEFVWMVEVRPKGSGQSLGTAPNIVTLTPEETTNIVG